MGRGMVEPMRFGIDAEPNAAPQGDKFERVNATKVVLATALPALAYGVVLSRFAQVQTMHVLLQTVVIAALCAFGSAWLQRRDARRLAASARNAVSRHIVLEKGRIWLAMAGIAPIRLFDLGRSFGASLLSNRARDRLVLALTSHEQALYIGSILSLDERRAYLPLLSWATTVPEDEMVLDATAPDGTPLHIKASDLETLLRALLLVDGGALERCYLSDTAGAPVELDGSSLRVGQKAFDLGAPLEWSASLFQEPVGSLAGANDWDEQPPPMGGVMVYQATWIRQGLSEVVLVSLLTSITANPVPIDLFVEHTPEVQSALLRDLRLMQASPEAPPPRELRVGIDRAYMVRLRAALDRAPRASQHSRRSSGAAAP